MDRKTALRLLACVVALCAITAPASAGTNLAVGEIHTTATDFNTGTLTNATIEGSGASANVSFSSTAPGNYTSENVEVQDSVTGFTNLTIENASVEVKWQQLINGVWSTSESGTYTTSGNKTADIDKLNNDGNWRVIVETTPQSGDTTVKLHDDGVLFRNDAPTVDNSSASPQGGADIDSGPVTLSIDVADDEFDETQGDSVTVEFWANGSQVGTDTLTSPGTATTTLSSPSAGTVGWAANVSDSYGGGVVSETFIFDLPHTLSVYNESAPDTLISSPTTVNVTFFGDDGETVVSRSTTNGQVDMTGLPTDTEFTVRADADGYLSRQTRIDSLFVQQSVYLPPDGSQTATIVFELDDATGRFPPSETTLFVERPLNISGQTQYQIVAGDDFGASNQFVTELVDNQRYRLRVENDAGETRVLGSYTASGDDTAVLPIGQLRFQGDVDGQPAFEAKTIEDSGQQAIRVIYRDPTGETTDLALEIVNDSNTSDVLRPNSTVTGPFGVYSETVVIPAGQNNTRWQINYHATRNTSDVGGTTYAGAVDGIAGGLGIDEQVLQLMGWVALLAITGLTVIISSRMGAVTAVVIGTIFTLIGVLAIPGPILGVAGAAAVLFVVGGDRL